MPTEAGGVLMGSGGVLMGNGGVPKIVGGAHMLARDN